MSKLVNENVIRKRIVRRDRAVEVENAATAVRAIIDEYLDKLVRRKLCDSAQGAVIESQHVSLGSEGVVGCADG